MVKLILSGCNGKMGRVIAECVRERNDCTVVAGLDLNTDMAGGFPVFADAADCVVEGDVIIDFSHPDALNSVLGLAARRNTPVVIATTGLSHAQVDQVHSASRQIPVFFTANMSLGVNLLVELAKTAARVLGQEYDIEIIEKHHNQKIDAPSGTALWLADEISGVLPQPPQYIHDRHSQRRKRTKTEVGIHAVRGGTIVGEHDVLFAGRDETITLSHRAASKEIFATGSLNAALFLYGKANGLYSMADLI